MLREGFGREKVLREGSCADPVMQYYGKKHLRQEKLCLFGLCFAYIQEAFIFVTCCDMTYRSISVITILCGTPRLRTVHRCVKQHTTEMQKLDSTKEKTTTKYFVKGFFWGVGWLYLCDKSCFLRFFCELRYSD